MTDDTIHNCYGQGLKLFRKALELAARDYYRGCKLVENQKEGLIQDVIDSWMAEANRLITNPKDPK